MVIDRIHTQTYLWVEKCIYSCKTYNQLCNATNLVLLYEKRLKEVVTSGRAPNSSLMFVKMLDMAWKHQERHLIGSKRKGKRKGG